MDFVDELFSRIVEEYEALKMESLRKIKKPRTVLRNDNWFLNYIIPKEKFVEELACGVDILVSPSELNFPYNIRFLCYPNGNSKENEGHVSFMFQELSSSFKNCVLNFTFTLIDEEGNQRFPQSYAKEYGKHVETTRKTMEPHGLSRYIKRNQLLSSDIFFSDMLHVKCEIHFYRKGTSGEPIKKPYEMRYSKKEDNIGTLYITDNSHTLWTLLVENSPYFKKILVTDGATKIYPFYKEDFLALNVITKSILQEEDPSFHHTDEALALYRFADRVLIPDFKRYCSNYLGENMSTNIVSEVIVMADIYSDPLLKDIAIQHALEHWQEVIASRNWKLLQERRPKLAAEIEDYKLGKEVKESQEIKREVSKININISEDREQFQFYL